MSERSAPAALTFERDGASLVPAAFAACLPTVRAVCDDLPQGEAGVRIAGVAPLRSFLLSDGPIGAIAARQLGKACRPVRAILFDKTKTMNWSLGWHQDRTICVKRRIDVAGFSRWNRKADKLHVEPPFDVLARMVTLRAHLDDVTADNAPLMISPGSHKCGRVAERQVAAVVSRHGQHTCLATAGDVWHYATPILHASQRAAVPTRRRVLQVDFSADDLPGGLEWFGV